MKPRQLVLAAVAAFAIAAPTAQAQLDSGVIRIGAEPRCRTEPPPLRRTEDGRLLACHLR